MKTSSLLRVSLLAAALGAALSAHAVSIGLISHGTFDLTTLASENISESVILQDGGYGPLSTLSASIVDVGNLPLAGTGTYSGSGGSLSFSLSETSVSFNNGFGTLNGTWTATGGTGTYLAATGGGTFAVVYNLNVNSDVKPSYTTFMGDVEAVPEPASLCALGVGAVGLLRRRKRA